MGKWVKRHIHKKHELVTVVPANFGPRFSAWWAALQPSWRLQDGDIFSKVPPKDETWSIVGKGGSAGLYIVIMTLSWWINSLDHDDMALSAWQIVADITWVLQQVSLRDKNLRGSKRACSDGDSMTDSKRYVQLC